MPVDKPKALQELWLKAKQSTCICKGQRSTSLRQAATKGCPQCCSRFARELGKAINGETALVCAAKKGHCDIVKLLAPYEAGKYKPGDKTALMYAMLANDSKSVEVLLPYEKDIKDHNNRAACSYVNKFNEELQRMVFEAIFPTWKELTEHAKETECVCKGASESLSSAARAGCVRCCIGYIWQAQHMTDDETTQPHATTAGHSDTVKELIPVESGVCSYQLITALMIAASAGHADVVRLLIPYEANIRTNKGFTALMCAASQDQVEAVVLLLPHEAGGQTARGETATHIALRRWSSRSFSVLCRDPIEAAASGIQPLHVAAFDGDIRALHHHRAQWQCKYDNGIWFFDLALLGGNARAVRFMMRQVSDANFFTNFLCKKFEQLELGSSDGRSLITSSLFGRHLLGIVCNATEFQREDLLLMALIYDSRRTFRMLRPFCTLLECSAHLRIAAEVLDKPRDDKTTPALSYKGVTLLRTQGWFDPWAKEQRRISARQSATWKIAWVQQNPTSSLDARRAGYVRDEPPESSEPANSAVLSDEDVEQRVQLNQREVESESYFSRALLLESRTFTWEAQSRAKLAHVSNTNQIRQKLALHRLLLLGFAHSLRCIVQDTLDE